MFIDISQFIEGGIGSPDSRGTTGSLNAMIGHEPSRRIFSQDGDIGSLGHTEALKNTRTGSNNFFHFGKGHLNFVITKMIINQGDLIRIDLCHFRPELGTRFQSISQRMKFVNHGIGSRMIQFRQFHGLVFQEIATAISFTMTTGKGRMRFLTK
mmetsp:Transcript_74242/g.214625  ORF Transcript_74242/g.214625 Transcript_74242/m.214625 type:complete len:154 (+) Transcript_74242:1221-1682(+)